MVIYTVLLFLGLCVGYAVFSTGIDLSVSGNFKVTADECFSVTDNGAGTGTIDNYDTSCGNKVNIPQSINGLSITKIGDTYGDSSATKVFTNKEIVKVILPKGLTYIGNYAFYGDKLKSIDIPSRITHICNFTFYGTNLSSVTFNEGLWYIGEHAFGNNNLKEISIPSSVNNIEKNSFEHNHNLTTIDVNRIKDALNSAPRGATNASINWSGTNWKDSFCNITIFFYTGIKTTALVWVIVSFKLLL